jgi:anaerobic ribonucleoside-triphosphate reductase activating protein
MRYNTIITNDVTNGEGVCVSFFVQGCPHHCSGCFNPETWDFNGGKLYNENVKWQIIKAISANGIERNFSILGGEPLAPQNIKMVEEIVTAVRIAYPNIKIFLWTGYEFENLDFDNKSYYNILSNIDVIIDGKFIEEQKDLSLKLRGSSNQNIWIKENNIWRKDNG